MPTDKPRFTITMDEALYKKIEDFKFSHRLKNQTQAVISLIEKGIDSLMEGAELHSEEKPLLDDEQRLVEDYRSLNEQGKEVIRQQMELLVESPRYKKSVDISNMEKRA